MEAIRCTWKELSTDLNLIVLLGNLMSLLYFRQLLWTKMVGCAIISLNVLSWTLIVCKFSNVYLNYYAFYFLERPRAVNCLTDGLLVDNNGVNYFSVREGDVLNSTCYVYGNPIPTLNCRTCDNAYNQQAALPQVIGNYTSYPNSKRMLFLNVRRAVTKVICVADGREAGKLTVERAVRVDCKYIIWH